MPTFLIETPHTDEECRIGGEQLLKLDLPRVQEIFDSTHAACEFGEHNAWLIGEFENEDEAWSYVPEIERPKAKIREVKTYSYEEMMKAHGG